ncbi:hypothetical protein DPEC_G00115070 [Dallia pectoralis]|uniref:Uncharacterized protein n=1 Tax=Dallia pectoralis TaxID=75939 RepID=A0ACC2GU64_DALPE|nr:hypothetical protein DPEC_G00115070 [Dallia pectoralis]
MGGMEQWLLRRVLRFLWLLVLGRKNVSCAETQLAAINILPQAAVLHRAPPPTLNPPPSRSSIQTLSRCWPVRPGGPQRTRWESTSGLLPLTPKPPVTCKGAQMQTDALTEEEMEGVRTLGVQRNINGALHLHIAAC